MTELDDVLALIPSNWCDPMLTGPDAVLSGHGGTWGCPDIERLLSAIRKRLLDSPELKAALEDARRWRWYQEECLVCLDEMDEAERQAYVDEEIAIDAAPEVDRG